MRFAQLINVAVTGRVMRLLVTLAVAPVLAMSPLSVDAMMIHYDGHDIHTHAVTSDDFGRWTEPPEHQHAAHDHDCQAHDPHDHGDEFFIVVDLPVAVAKGRTSGIASLVLVSATQTPCPAVTPMAIIENVSLHSGAFDHAPHLRPTRSVSRILQANHALLL